MAVVRDALVLCSSRVLSSLGAFPALVSLWVVVCFHLCGSLFMVGEDGRDARASTPTGIGSCGRSGNSAHIKTNLSVYCLVSGTAILARVMALSVHKRPALFAPSLVGSSA